MTEEKVFCVKEFNRDKKGKTFGRDIMFLSKHQVYESDSHRWLYNPRDLKSIAFICWMPLLFEIKKIERFRGRKYLLYFYGFADTSDRGAFDALVNYMKQNYSVETWEIFDCGCRINMYCSCSIDVSSIRKLRYHCIDSESVMVDNVNKTSLWLKSAFCNNRDFKRLVCCGENEDLLYDMLLKQLRRYYLTYDNVLSDIGSVVLADFFAYLGK